MYALKLTWITYKLELLFAHFWNFEIPEKMTLDRYC